MIARNERKRGTMNFVFSQAFEEFVRERTRLGQADVDLAHNLLGLKGEEVRDEKTPNYLDIVLVDNNPRITYTTGAKAAALAEEERFTRRGLRVIARPGSVVQKLLGKEQNGHAMDRFVQAANTFLNPPDMTGFSLLEGEAIWDVFDYDKLCGCGSSWCGARGSCMVSKDVRNARPGIEFYVEHCRVAVYRCPKCDKINSRSIVWVADDGVLYHDRIYGSSNGDHSLVAYMQTQGITDAQNAGLVVHFSREVFEKYDALTFPALDTMHHRCDTCWTLAAQTCPLAEGGVYRYGGEYRWNYGERRSHKAAGDNQV